VSCFHQHERVARSRLGLVLFAYVLRGATALGLAWPVAKALAPRNVMALPRMDRELYAPGARVLLQTLTEQGFPRFPWLRWGWGLGSVLLFIGAIGAAVLLSALAKPAGAKPFAWWRAATRALPTITAISTFGSLTIIAVAWVARTALPIIPAFIYPLLGEKGADAALVAVAFGVAFVALLTFTITDLARAAAIAFETGARTSLSVGIEVFGNHSGKCLAGAAGYLVASFILPLGIEALLPKTSVSNSEMLVAVAVIHQLTVFILCALHLCWWSLSLKIVRIPPERNESQEEDLVE
jgi:hypothetical protein